MNELIKLIEEIEPYYEMSDSVDSRAFDKSQPIVNQCIKDWEVLPEEKKEELFNTISSEGMFNLRRYVAPNYKINLEV